MFDVNVKAVLISADELSNTQHPVSSKELNEIIEMANSIDAPVYMLCSDPSQRKYYSADIYHYLREEKNILTPVLEAMLRYLTMDEPQSKVYVLGEALYQELMVNYSNIVVNTPKFAGTVKVNEPEPLPKLEHAVFFNPCAVLAA